MIKMHRNIVQEAVTLSFEAKCLCKSLLQRWDLVRPVRR